MRAEVMAIMVLLGVGCSSRAPNDLPAPPSTPSQASEAAESPEDAGAGADATCAPGSAYDAAAFTFRASCTYPVPSEAGALAACDEWAQGGVSDWGDFIERCIDENATISAQPCAEAGQVGACTYAPTCEGSIASYFYGAEGTASFQRACTAAGGSWSALP